MSSLQKLLLFTITAYFILKKEERRKNSTLNLVTIILKQ